MQGNEDAKTRYKPEKVLLKESTKSVASKKSTRKGSGRCSKCNQLHHNARVCLMPAMPKQSRGKIGWIDWYAEFDDEVIRLASKKKRKVRAPELLD